MVLSLMLLFERGNFAVEYLLAPLFSLNHALVQVQLRILLRELV